MSESNISHRCVQTSSPKDGGNHLNHSSNMASSVTLITCSVKWLQPSLLDSKEKNVRILSKEWMGRFCQLWWPRLQAAQVKLLKQFFLPLFSWSSLVPGHLGPHPMHLSCWATSVAQAPGWQLPLLPLGSSSSGSEGMLYHFLPWQQHSYCHYAFHCRHSVPINLGAMCLLQHIGSGSSHSISQQWIQSLSLQV